MKFPGIRIVKTTVAVFFTALLCQWIGWPPVFAVITAVVTLEPTISDSIKKGIVRFPASAIGSFYAVLFISLFGNSVITYTLAASLTILTCYKLRLHAGLLVATITAVAMVEVIHDNYFMSFFIRLGTTSIGIIVSTLVNMFILPPNYMKEINQNLHNIYSSLATSLSLQMNEKLHIKMEDNIDYRQNLQNAKKKLKTTEELIRYQVDESRLHPLVSGETINFIHLQQQMNQLRLIHYHVTNIENIYIEKNSFLLEKVDLLINATKELQAYMSGNTTHQMDKYEKELKLLLDLYWQKKNPTTSKSALSLPHELIFLYELISIFYVVKNFHLVEM